MSDKIINREKKQLAILESSYYFFLKNGIKNSSLELLLKQLNMGKGTFYHYFKSKDELIKKLILNLVDLYIKICDKKLKKCSNIKDKLETLFELYLIETIEYKEFIKLYSEYLIIYSNDKIIEDEYKIHHEYINSTLKQIIKEEILNKNIKEEALDFINSLNPTADGMMLYSFLLEDFNLQKEFRSYLDNFLNLVIIKKEQK